MHTPRRNTMLPTLAAAALLATLTATAHTQGPELPAPLETPEPPRLQTFRVKALVQDLGILADVIEAWDRAPLEVLALDLGPKSGTNGERLLKASLQSPDMDSVYLPSKEIVGFDFTAIYVVAGETSPAPLTLPSPLPVKNATNGRYDLNFTHLDFGPDAEKGKLAVRKEVYCLDGNDVSLEGYMIPLQWDGKDGVTEFMLVAHMAECCFGGAPEYDEWVHVRAPKGKPVEYLPYKPIRIQGKFVLPSLRPNKQNPEFDVAYRLLEAALEQGAK